MSSTTRAAQIASLSDQLRPLGTKARGMRLTADEWNVIVGAIAAMLKIDREQDEDVATRLDQAYARADHQHLGQVSLAWLDPELQSIVGAGGGSVSTRQALAAMEQTVEGLRAEVGRLTEVVERQQELIDRALAADSDRSEQLRDFETRFAGVEDLRAAVTAIAQGQNSIRNGVNEVVELRAQLSPGGSPIDLAALTQRVQDLQVLRESFTGIDGKPLRLKDIQLEIKQLAGKVPASAGGAGAPGLDARLAALSNELKKHASEEADKRVDIVRDEVRNARGEIVAEVGTTLAQNVAVTRASAVEAARELVNGAEARLGATLAGEVNATRSQLTATLRQQAGEAVAAGLAGVDTRMTGLLESRAQGLRTQLTSEFQNVIAARLDEGLAQTAQRLDLRLSQAETRIFSVAEAIPQRLEESVQALRTGLEAKIEDDVLNHTSSIRLSLTDLVDQRVRTSLDTGLIEIRAAADETVSSALRDVDARIDFTVNSATRSLIDDVTQTVDTRISAFNIPGQIASATSEVVSVLRSEIAVTAATVQQSAGTAINSAILDLKGELAAPQTNTGIATQIFTRGTKFPGGKFPG